MTENMFAVLGAPDPEMERIEALLRSAGVVVLYAAIGDGRRVRADDAYQADSLIGLVGWDGREATVLAVECDGPAVRGFASEVTTSGARYVDHHRPGDPGYGHPPEEFLPASSLGQVIRILAAAGRLPWHGVWGLIPWAPGDLRWRATDSAGRPDGSWHVGIVPAGMFTRVPADLVLAAAADHCLAAAYRGWCPGVDPDALLRWRVETRAVFQRRDPAAVLADIEAARAIIRSAPVLVLGTIYPKRACLTEHQTHDEWCPECARAGVSTETVLALDLRGQHVPELPEAAAREGVCIVADGLPGRDGRRKVVCQSGRPAQIETFMRQWAPQVGLRDVYGDPQRGFAGGYLEGGS